jgi:RNA polymerase sigma-70 factor (ECF subfamily)
LFRIARNIAIDHYRKNGRHPQASLHENLTDSNGFPEASLERTLTSEILNRALTELTEEQREVIILRFVAGLPIAEVSRALDKSEDAVKGLQRRALANLRQILKEWKVAYEQE